MGPIEKALREASALLTPETWIRASYFRWKDGHACYCAHGAVQQTVNPQFAAGAAAEAMAEAAAEAAEAMAEAARWRRAAAAATAEAMTTAGTAAAAKAAAAAVAAAERAVAGYYNMMWKNRPGWLTPLNSANYMLALVGCTFSYNDKHSYEDIQAMFTKAIETAKELGV